MSEETWADRCEWKRDRGEIEIKRERDLGAGFECAVRSCLAPAIKEYEIGLMAETGSGVPIDVCSEHDDEELVFEIYQRFVKGDRQ